MANYPMVATQLHYIFLQQQLQDPCKTSSVLIYGAKAVADEWVLRATPISSPPACRKQSLLPQDGTALCSCTSNLRCETNSDDSLLPNYKTIWSRLWNVASLARCRRQTQLQVQLPSQHKSEIILTAGRLPNALHSKTGHLGERPSLVSPWALTKSWHQGLYAQLPSFVAVVRGVRRPAFSVMEALTLVHRMQGVTAWGLLSGESSPAFHPPDSSGIEMLQATSRRPATNVCHRASLDLAL